MHMHVWDFTFFLIRSCWKNVTHSIHLYLVNVKYSCYKCVTVTLREMQNPSNSSQQCPTTCVFSSPSDKQDTRGIHSMNWALESRSQIQTVWICNFDLHVFCWKISKGYVQLHVKTNMCDFIFTILVWHDSLLEAGLKLCMCNLFDTITFMDMSNQNLSVYDIGCFKITLCELSPGKPNLKFLQVQSLMLMWISHFSG